MSVSKKNHASDKALGHLGDGTGGSGAGAINDTGNQLANNSNSMNSIREHALHSPLYNLQHNLSHSMHANHSNNSSGGQYVQSGKFALSEFRKHSSWVRGSA